MTDDIAEFERKIEEAGTSRLFTARVEHPAKRSLRQYLILLRRILSHPAVYSLTLDPTRPIEVGYVSHALDQTLGARLEQTLTAEEVFQRVAVTQVPRPLHEGLVYIMLESEKRGLAPCRVYVRDLDTLKSLGWAGGDTFMQATIEEYPALPPGLLAFGLAPDTACSGADIQQLWGLFSAESTAGGIQASAQVPPSSGG